MITRERQARPATLARIVVPVLVGLAGLSACSDETLSSDHLPDDTPQATYSAEERRSAERLSMGNVAAIDAAGSEYRQAALCVVALETVSEMAEDGSTMTTEQRAAIQQALRIFEQRARRSAAADASVVPAEERLALEAQYPERRERAQLALGCLRKL
ncbi:hypothetical protein [Qipengyuania sp. MTN3-11]|uniref:hypothetical protein n=1 Tax=Qipengyuania sp. MTN3-11 TaxID=3056557 RepID=UPI0036F302FC